MSSSIRNPSNRFRRAAEAERAKLLNDRRRLAADHERLLAEARRLADSVAEIDAQVQALGLMLGTTADSDPTEVPAEQPEAEKNRNGDLSAARLLSGPAIREAALDVLMRQPEYIEAIHYRRWYDLLLQSGYEVAGKNPPAVFLTQLSRSPVVHKNAQSGVYEIDRQAPLRLRQRFERLNAELLELSTVPAGNGDATSNAAKRRELTTAISRTEKALEEALRVLTRKTEDVDANSGDAPMAPPAVRLTA